MSLSRRSARSARTGQTASAHVRQRRLFLEPLEPRACPATFVVDLFTDENDGNNSAGDLSLREAVILANANDQNDTIQLAAGTYALTIPNAPNFPIEDASMTGDLDVFGRHILFEGAGRDATVIDAIALGDRILETYAAGSVGLFDLTLRGGNSVQASPSGGAFLNRGRSTMLNVAVTGNHGVHLGGGIYNDSTSAHLTINSSVFSGNVSDQGGGAIGNNLGTVAIFSSSFVDNRGLLEGGAIWTSFGSLSVQGSTFTNNSASALNAGGGAISSRTFGLTIDSSTFRENEATFGGAISGNDKLILRNSTLASNRARKDGGGIYLRAAAINQPHEIVNNTFSGNTAEVGGGIYTDAWSTIVNNTITANRGTLGVGGVDNNPGQTDTRFRNNIIAGNIGTTLSPDVFGDFKSLGGNLVGSRGDATGLAQADDQVGTVNAPINPLLGPLASNGGPTQTRALLVGSRAIDRGRNASDPTTDQRGLPRIVNGTVDIGSFEVQPGNAAPVAEDQSFGTDEDVVLTGQLVATDADGTSLTFTRLTNATAGNVIVQPNGQFLYFPPLNFSGTATFTFRASDGTLTDNATVTINVRPVNDAPFFNNPTTFTIAEDATLSDNIDFVDVEGDAVTFSLLAGGPSGSVTVNPDGTFQYTPAPNFTGLESFSFRARDDEGAFRDGVVTIEVTPVNDAPIANDDQLAVDEDQTLTLTALPITRLFMHSEPGDFIGQGLTYDYSPPPPFDVRRNFDNGVRILLAPPGTFWELDFAAPFDVPLGVGYFPDAMRFPFQNANRPGLTVFGDGRGHNELVGKFTVQDATYAPDGSVVSFAASFVQQGLNSDDTVDPPLRGTIQYNTTIGAAAGVLANDIDVDGDVLLSGVLVAGPANGSLMLNRDGTLAYTPNPNFSGVDTFTYRTSDGQAVSNVATVTIAVKPVADPPFVADDSATTAEDTAVTIAVLANDGDPDGDVLVPTLVAAPANGQVVRNADGTLTYSPVANFHGNDSFTYEVSDGLSISNRATVSIVVTPINDAPAAQNDSAATDEDTPVTIAVLANDTDVDGDTLGAVVLSSPTNGSLTVNADGSITFTPIANFHGSDSFTYAIGDGALISPPATVAIVVRNVNDAPAAGNDSATASEDTPVSIPVLANDSDLDGDAVAPVIVTAPANGSLTVNADGSIAYTPTANFHGSDSFTYRASDGTAVSNIAIVNIQVLPVNDAPTAGDDFFATLEDTPLFSVALPGVLSNDADLDGDLLAAILASGPSHGTLALQNNGSFVYTPAADFSGSDSFTYRVSDRLATSQLATVSVEILPVNDAPVANEESYTLTQNAPLVIAALGVLANDTDPDDDALAAVLVGGPAHGTLTLNANGSFTYTPAAGYVGSDSFTYKASDGSAVSAVTTVSLSVEAAQPTLGKINGIGSLDRGRRSFFINVQGQEHRKGIRYQGQFRFIDSTNRICLESTTITHLQVEADGQRATFRGSAKVNGKSGYTFVVWVDESGSGPDRFRVQILGPGGFAYDSLDYALNAGLIDWGHINVRKR